MSFLSLGASRTTPSLPHPYEPDVRAPTLELESSSFDRDHQPAELPEGHFEAPLLERSDGGESSGLYRTEEETGCKGLLGEGSSLYARPGRAREAWIGKLPLKLLEEAQDFFLDPSLDKDEFEERVVPLLKGWVEKVAVHPSDEGLEIQAWLRLLEECLLLDRETEPKTWHSLMRMRHVALLIKGVSPPETQDFWSFVADYPQGHKIAPMVQETLRRAGALNRIRSSFCLGYELLDEVYASIRDEPGLHATIVVNLVLLDEKQFGFEHHSLLYSQTDSKKRVRTLLFDSLGPAQHRFRSLIERLTLSKQWEEFRFFRSHRQRSEVGCQLYVLRDLSLAARYDFDHLYEHGATPHCEHALTDYPLRFYRALQGSSEMEHLASGYRKVAEKTNHPELLEQVERLERVWKNNSVQVGRRIQNLYNERYRIALYSRLAWLFMNQGPSALHPPYFGWASEKIHHLCRPKQEQSPPEEEPF
jgi:hypothetical protein